MTRVVLDTRDGSNFSVSMESNPNRMVVELRQSDRALAAKRPTLTHDTASAKALASLSVKPEDDQLRAKTGKFRIALDAGHGLRGRDDRAEEDVLSKGQPVGMEEPEPAAMRGDLGRITGLESGQREYRILVCEDEPTSPAVLMRFLQSAGFQVRVADNGAKGVELFESWRPDFIWMDLRMPVMSGVEAARRIRATEGGQGVKIAAVSASAFAEERSEVLAAGMNVVAVSTSFTRQWLHESGLLPPEHIVVSPKLLPIVVVHVITHHQRNKTKR